MPYRPTAAVVLIALASVAAAPAGAQDQQDLEATVIVEAPATGIGLGWGWNTFQAEPVPTICVEFSPGELTAQTTTLDFQEVNDSFELMQAMNVSGEVSVKAVGYEASGKASFAKQVNVTGTSSTFVIGAEVQNGARFTAPAPPRGGRSVPGVTGDGAIRLTAEARTLARRKPEEFKQVCGNAFVSATIGGASLSAVVSINTSTRREKETVRAAVSGKGWGAKVDVAMGSDTASGTSSYSREISFYQAGGREQDLPTDTASILKRVQELAVAASQAEKLSQIAITPYAVLENWPRANDLTGEEAEFDQIASLWGAYNTLYDELQQALDNPTTHVAPSASTCPAGTCTVTFERLSADPVLVTATENLQDAVLVALSDLELAAEQCVASEEACTFQEDTFRSPYAIRARMPVSPCLLVDAPAPATTADCIPATTALTAITVDKYAAVTIRAVAKSRCRFGSLTPGCMSNALIRQWTSRVGMDSMLFADAAAMATFTKDLPNGITITANDPGLGTPPVIWYAADTRTIIDGQIKTAGGG